VVTERLGGMSTVVAFGQRRAERARYSGTIEAAYGFARRVAVFQGAFLGSSYLVGNGALLGVLVLGAGQVVEGNLTAGSLAGFCESARCVPHALHIWFIYYRYWSSRTIGICTHRL